MASSDSSAAGMSGTRDELLSALTSENARLRAANSELAAQVEQMRAAQSTLARHLRVTAPLRQVQEGIRLWRMRRRLDAPTSAEEASRAWPPPPRSLTVTPGQLAGHPLLRRTIEQVAGRPMGGDPADLNQPVTGRRGRIAVVVHVYYPELWPELAHRVRRIPAPVDLVVTLVHGHSEALADRIVAEFPEVRLVLVPNRGRDLWPFVRVLELGLVGDHDAVLKLHTKASVHRVDGAAWRRSLLDSLCPSPQRIALALELFARDPGLGMIAPAGAALGREFWGANGPLIEALAVRSGVGVDPARTRFAGGSMFWARPGPLLRIRDAGLTIDDFEHEAVSIDGTTAHALERFLGALVGAAGLSVIEADEVPGRLARTLAPPAQAAPGRDAGGRDPG